MDIPKAKGMSAREFMASLSTAGREEFPVIKAPKPQQDSTVISISRWIDGRWVKKFYQWDGASYSVDVSQEHNPSDWCDRSGRIW